MLLLFISVLNIALLAALAIYIVNSTIRQKQTDLSSDFQRLSSALTDQEKRLRDELERSRSAIGENFKHLSDSTLSRMSEIATLQKNQLDTFTKQLEALTKSNEERQDKLRDSVEKRLQHLQEDNAKKLEQMRQTVDEKLQSTLEKRLGESFKQVSDRLEKVHHGLGEMQHLANGVGDLKKVLSNVKTRGTWGEVQLAALLEQVLSPEQYAANVATKPNGREFVEFAIKLPGKTDNSDEVIWLPIDAKFPQDCFEHVINAQEAGDLDALEVAYKQLDQRIKLEGKNIKEKYLDPPHTTDFGILFLPTEGLYAEVLRRPGLTEGLQRDHRVIVTGPTTLAALLNSLQMGFRTLAIEKRSSEVWEILGKTKTEFSRFGDLLDKTKKKLQEASNVIDSASVRSRAIERTLRGVEALPEAEASILDAADLPSHSDEQSLF